MRAKLLFGMGIALTHGALGAAWIRAEAPELPVAATSCLNTPAPLPYIEPKREMLAMYMVPAQHEDVQQP